jgi:hypothetical protein
MARGGYRPGAGRPRTGESAPGDEAEAAAQESDVTPLEYMMAVINDPKADPLRRDRMAIAAAPFVHPKAGETGKKEERAAQAKTAQNGTEWEDLLKGPTPNLQ